MLFQEEYETPSSTPIETPPSSDKTGSKSEEPLTPTEFNQSSEKQAPSTSMKSEGIESRVSQEANKILVTFIQAEVYTQRDKCG